MSAARVEAQASFFPLPPAMPVYRRIVCACGCGRWFYWQRAKHRPPAYATPGCYRREYNRRRREAFAAVAAGVGA